MTTRCAIYARISVTTLESVSIERQIESGQQYAAAKGWQVLDVFTDEGVSASKIAPEDRAGWGALLASSKKFDTVIIWKIDRLARSALDFLNADKALQKQGRALVSVEDALDLTTEQGRAMATMTAVFARMEAAAIAARVKAARVTLIRDGRLVGGRVPYGWRSLPNPNGPGWVLAKDPERIDTVRGMVERMRRGGTLYGVQKWLIESGAPTPAGKGTWLYNSVERLLRNPVLAGMTPYNPGNDGKNRGAGLRRDKNGLPHVDPAIAIMSQEEWRAMVRGLDERESAQSLPRSTVAKTSGLLSGLVRCGRHLDDDGNGTRMHRGTTQKRHGYICPVCHMTITNFEPLVIAEFLRQKGERVRWTKVDMVQEGGQAELPEIELALNELDAAIRASSKGDTRKALQVKQSNLLDLRDEKREQAPVTEPHFVDAGTFGDDWAAAEGPLEQRDVLGDALAAVWVVPGPTGRRTEAGILARLVFEWKFPEDIGPLETPDDETLARWAE
jgi:site-specific DNA recombinase